MPRKSRAWKTMLFIASLAYLVIEIMFNATLVDIASSVEIGQNDPLLHSIELFGRAISGIGISLLILDLIPARYTNSMSAKIILTLLVLGIVWPTVYFGQKALIDHYLIDPSTTSQRKQAVASTLLKQAMSNNAISFEGIAFDAQAKAPSGNRSAEDLTFLAIFGGLVYVDDNLALKIKDQQHAIIRNYVRARSSTDFSSQIQAHRKLYDRLSSAYSNEYVPASERYNTAMASIPRKQTAIWAGIETDLNGAWTKYQNAVKAHIARSEARAQEYGPKIYEHFKQFQHNCVNNGRVDNRCAREENTRYKTMITKAGYGHIQREYWLIEEDINTSTQVLSTLGNALMTGGGSLIAQVVDKATGGDGGWKDKRLSFTNNAEHYKTRFLALPAVEAEFITQTSYPLGLDNIAFRAHANTQEKIRDALQKQGLTLPSTWTIYDQSALNHAISQKVQRDTTAAWEKEMRAKGYTMPPNMSWKMFEVHDDIQTQIKREMKENYIPKLRASWSDREFSEKVIEPAIARKVKEVEKLLAVIETDFADGGQYEELGKSSLRAVLIPPISMILSLFLICITLIKLPFKIYGLMQPDIEPRRSHKKAAPQHLLQRASQRIKFAGITLLGAVAPLFIVALTPFYLADNQYTSTESNVTFFIQQIEEKNKVAAASLTWLLRTQPLMQPLGAAFANNVDFKNKIVPITTRLDALDTKIKTTGR